MTYLKNSKTKNLIIVPYHFMTCPKIRYTIKTFALIVSAHPHCARHCYSLSAFNDLGRRINSVFLLMDHDFLTDYIFSEKIKICRLGV